MKKVIFLNVLYCVYDIGMLIFGIWIFCKGGIAKNPKGRVARISSCIIGGISIIFCVLGFFDVVLPFFQDIPNIINKNYSYAEGYVLEKNTMQYVNYIVLEDQNSGEKIDISNISRSIQVGDYVQIEYLPHIRTSIAITKDTRDS